MRTKRLTLQQRREIFLDLVETQDGNTMSVSDSRQSVIKKYKITDMQLRQIEEEGEQGTLGLFAAADQRWVVARIAEKGRQRMAKIAAEHSQPWRDLGVSILHRLLIDDLLDGKSLPKPRYVHLVDEVTESLESDEFQLAVLVMPATIEHIQTISEHQERMPAKSTYFYPKLLSGLVINPLE